MNRQLLTKTIILCLIGLMTGCNAPKATSFEIGDKQFLLNGEAFVIKAAEMHYTRIPRPYWEHRIKMSKALGMNSICLYIFWNIHEQEPGVFDFEGQNDVAEFCRMAQKEGMYVIIRPGPYVCAEWEMGGLPWWLLKKEGIALRSQDPYYLERVEIFMNEVGRQLAGLQINRGGNIIMVQVENEFGSYGTDKPYVEDIRDIVRAAGFTDVPLFQCDWNSNFQNNALDDLLWTINFGTGANIDNQFRELKRLRPNTPLMCSEFWSGWFDRWGSPHETRSAEELVKGMQEMLEKDISFSLYMTHGGSTFGHWTGANSPPYASWCSSYDYDAPINEAGQTTEKFYAVRELLAKYSDKALPKVPKALPMIEIPPFELNQIAPLFQNLPEPILSDQVHSMEFFDQGYGSILYRTTLPAGAAGRKLIVEEAHDWAIVFVDGKRLGTLDRRKAEKILELPATEKEAVLDILVENMGRVNYSKTIHDYKGITQRVSVQEGRKEKELTGFQVYRFPVEDALNGRLQFVERSQDCHMPAYYKGSFNLDKTGDVYIDMQNWSKGLVWINGYGIGRFWEIGPQQTLFVPGCWLNKGQNEIIVLDLQSPLEPVISGITTPILDKLLSDEETLERNKNANPDESGYF